MTFQSLEFLIFISVVLPTYLIFKENRKRNLLLLFASYFFYAFGSGTLLVLILFSTTVDYYSALQIESRPQERKQFLIVSLVANLGLLAYFKYTNFFLDSINSASIFLDSDYRIDLRNIALPVGISFYTFQSLSYTIDVYRGRLKATKNFFDFALFVTLFPQLVAGPIEKARDILPQIRKREVRFEDYPEALMLVLWGLFKKLVIADNVATVVNALFSVIDLNPYWLFVAAVGFAIQIYADFSAYTDMARGIARFFGFNLSMNFNKPYTANSPADFWRRWHITLSSWFREYVYIPLGGNRFGYRRRYFNLLVTFLLSGLWHGASWNFVLWGGYWGVLIIIENIISRIVVHFNIKTSRTLPLLGLKYGSILITFFLALAGWVIFRIESISRLEDFYEAARRGVSWQQYEFGSYLLIYLAIYASPMIFEHISKPKTVFWRDWGVHIVNAILILTIILLKSPLQNDFIYFAF